MSRKIKLEINGKPVEAEEDTTILNAAKAAGIEIPTLCYNEKMEPYGACRICVVEITKDNRTRHVASCAYPVEEGLKVRTNTDKIKKMRKTLLELMLSLAPNSGPLLSLAGINLEGETSLREKEHAIAQVVSTEKYGAEENRFKADPTDCILCGLCVRYCATIKKANAVTFVGRGTERRIAFVPEIAPYECPSCQQCYSLCVGGKITEAESQDALSMPITQKKLPKPKIPFGVTV